MGKKWEKEDDTFLTDNYDTLSMEELSSRLQRTKETIYTRAHGKGLQRKPKILSEPKRPTVARSGEILFNEACEKQADRKVIHEPEKEFGIEFSTEDYPKGIFLIIMSDWHLGSVYTDYWKIKRDLDTLQEIPNAFCIMAGDIIDNFKSIGAPKGGQNDAMYTVGEQKKMASHIFKEYGDQMIAILSGCHDNWTMQSEGWDITQTYGEDILGISLGHGGMINVTVGSVLYKIYARHKYKFNSSFNLTHAVKKMHDVFGEFDIGILGHRHEPAFEECYKQGKKLLAISNGSYKGLDSFADRLGYRESFTGCTVIYLDPNKKDFTAFSSMDKAVTFMNGLLAGDE